MSESMSIMTIIFIALGLSMDAFAVAVANGFQIKQQHLRHAARIALFFGGFQAIMPVIGWLAGTSVRNFISGFDHWIAFTLLCFIGVKMIYESLTILPDEKVKNASNISVLLILSIATSIDALAVGLSLSFLKINIITPAAIIGVMTFVLSFMGVYIGKTFGHFFERKLEIAGGIILIGIGIKILIQHTI
jgi:putative Mn2+ efflux pump MntP